MRIAICKIIALPQTSFQTYCRERSFSRWGSDAETCSKQGSGVLFAFPSSALPHDEGQVFIELLWNSSTQLAHALFTFSAFAGRSLIRVVSYRLVFFFFGGDALEKIEALTVVHQKPRIDARAWPTTYLAEVYATRSSKSYVYFKDVFSAVAHFHGDVPLV